MARAGLTIRLCDIDPETLDLDLGALVQLDLTRALCIVPSGLYGLPGELSELELIARAFGAFLIDDAAQCLGATRYAWPCGTFGDAGFYSLGRGKGVTTMGGGILVTDRLDLAPRIEARVAGLGRPSAATVGVAARLADLFRHAASVAVLAVDRIPFLDLGASHFDPEFPMTGLSTHQRRLAEQVLPFVDSYNEVRHHHADHLRSGLEGVGGITIPRPVARHGPGVPALPVLTRDPAHRASLLQGLRESGISASASYPTAIGDIPGIAPHLAADQARCPAAADVASRILTLPTHPWVTDRDVEAMVTIIRGRS